MDKLFKNALVFIDGAFVNKDVYVKNGKIADLKAPCCLFDACEEIDCGGGFLVPGFIDIHTHGGAGVDVNSATPEDFETLARFFASKGVTSFLASVLTDSEENTIRVLNTIAGYKLSKHAGANLLGAHLEGPFLSPDKKGAMPEQFLKSADLPLFERYAESGVVKYVTVAPEITGGLALINHISKEIPVAIGHSAAVYEVAQEAIANGAKAATHTFNAMRGIDRVEPAILGAALDSDIYCEIIADGKHVHPANIRMLYKLKGNKRMIAITDSIQAAGMSDGQYKLGVNDVTVCAGEAFLTGTHSRAGSVLTADNALKNLVSFLNVSPEEVIPMFTENPADLFGLNKGFIRIGYDADFTLLDKQLNVLKTYIGG